MKAIILVFILGLGIVGSLPAQGKVNEKLREFFETEMEKLNQEVIHSESSSHAHFGEPGAQETWFLNRFRLYFRASFGFEVDGFSKFLVQPEVELMFVRFPAPGWAPYRPGKD